MPVLDAMVVDSGVRLDSLKVDGGATVNNMLMQLQADILGVTVVRPTVAETTALGAAYFAGLAIGFWGSLDELRQNWKADPRVERRRATRSAPTCVCQLEEGRRTKSRS